MDNLELACLYFFFGDFISFFLIHIKIIQNLLILNDQFYLLKYYQVLNLYELFHWNVDIK